MAKVLTVPDSTPAFSVLPTFGTSEVTVTPAVGSGGGGVQSVTAESEDPGISVDNTDPANPVLFNTGVHSIAVGPGLVEDISGGATAPLLSLASPPVVAVRAATTQALPAYTLISGTIAGGNAVWEANAVGAFPTLDGYASLTADNTAAESVNARFLFHHGGVDNGVRVLTVQGDGATKFRFKQYSKLLTANDVNGSKVRVLIGLQKGGAEYVYRAVATYVPGTTIPYWWRIDNNAGHNELSIVIDTDFQDGAVSTTATQVVTGGCFTQLNANSGTSQIISPNTGTASRAGVMATQTGAVSAAGRGLLTNGNQGNQYLLGLDVGFFLEYSGGRNTESDGTNTYSTLVGFSDTVGSIPAAAQNVIAITTMPAVGANVFITTANGTTITNTDTGRTPVGGVYDHIIARKDPGDPNVYAWINGGPTIIINTSVPSAVPMTLAIQALKSAGTANRQIESDILRCHVYWPKGRAA